MGWPKGKPRPPGSGRVKGTKNKFTGIREAFYEVFQERGKEGLKKWAEEDPGGFYRTTAGLLPKEVRAEVEGEILLKWQE